MTRYTLPVLSSLCIAIQVSATVTEVSKVEGVPLTNAMGQCMTGHTKAAQAFNSCQLASEKVLTVQVQILNVKLFEREVKLFFNILRSMRGIPKLFNERSYDTMYQ